MTFRSPCLLLLFALLLMSPAWGDAYREDDLQLWTPVTLEKSVTDKSSVFVEVGPRLGNNITGMNTLYLRSGGNLDLTDRLSLGAGYTWLYYYQPRDRQESQPFQQAQYVHPLGRWSITHRTRIEERLLEDAANPVVRHRQLVRVRRPLGKSPWYLTASNELFFNYNGTAGGPRSGIDQDRVYAAVGRSLGRFVRVEGGYMLQWINRQPPTVDVMNHIIHISLFIQD